LDIFLVAINESIKIMRANRNATGAMKISSDELFEAKSKLLMKLKV
jgi:hypothetical protein